MSTWQLSLTDPYGATASLPYFLQHGTFSERHKEQVQVKDLSETKHCRSESFTKDGLVRKIDGDSGGGTDTKLR